jgi:6-phosphogluconolactonase
VAAAVVVGEDLAQVVEAAAAEIRRAAAAAIAARGRFRIALAGGTTPRALYPLLVQGIDWASAEIFFGDERAVPPIDPRSNYRMARETLLEPAGIAGGCVRRWRAEDWDLDAAARDYERVLGGGPLDLALLGLGPDGHTASLFPGSPALAEMRRLAVATDGPKVPPGPRRLTLTFPVFSAAREVVFLVTGAEKAVALARVLQRGSALPAARIVHRSGPVTIFCDREAASIAAPPAPTTD